MYVKLFYLILLNFFVQNGNATYMYEFSYMYTKMVLTPMLVTVSYESTWDPKTCTRLSENFTVY